MDYGEQYTAYQLKKRGRFRSVMRELYLNHMRKLVRGPAIDFGCGVGELLRKLPPRSVGLEINEATVRYCVSNNLDVSLYDLATDQYGFRDIPENEFQSFVMYHVLEHLEGPLQAITRIMESCERLGIQRIIVAVPGKKGFQSDSSHAEFIEYPFFETNGLLNHGSFSMTSCRYFPVNLRCIGDVFTYHEMIVVYDRKDS
jgi:SAM-dependent methyltransferase